MGLRDYRGYEQVKPQRQEPDRKNEKKSKKLYIQRQLRNKRKMDKKLRNSTLMVASLIFITGAIIVGRDVKIYKTQQSIDQTKKESKLVKEKNEDLKIKLLQNSSLEKIEKIAREKLKMINPNGEDIVDFKNPNKPIANDSGVGN